MSRTGPEKTIPAVLVVVSLPLAANGLEPTLYGGGQLVIALIGVYLLYRLVRAYARVEELATSEEVQAVIRRSPLVQLAVGAFLAAVGAVVAWRVEPGGA